MGMSKEAMRRNPKLTDGSRLANPVGDYKHSEIKTAQKNRDLREADSKRISMRVEIYDFPLAS